MFFYELALCEQHSSVSGYLSLPPFLLSQVVATGAEVLTLATKETVKACLNWGLDDLKVTDNIIPVRGAWLWGFPKGQKLWFVGELKMSVRGHFNLPCSYHGLYWPSYKALFCKSLASGTSKHDDYILMCLKNNSPRGEENVKRKCECSASIWNWFNKRIRVFHIVGGIAR